jgi:FlaG/FlaF family flagellin (archaellin)
MRSTNEGAVAEVEGEMLMVVVTVLMAAIIAAMLFGLVSNLTSTKIIAITAVRNSSDYVILTNHGGKDVANLASVNVTGDVDPGSVILNSTGSTQALKLTKTNNSHVVVVGNFTDGKYQVLLDTYV